jgi:four helix bundle protein
VTIITLGKIGWAVAFSGQHSAFSQQGALPVKNFRDLQVWSKAHELTLRAYQVIANFPNQEVYGLTNQIRRCAASIGANIAEGCGKRGNAEFQRYLNIAAGSASELEYHFLLARDLHMLPDPDYAELDRGVVGVKRMLAALVRKVESERFRVEC